MTTKVKICGLTRPEDVDAAIRFGADYLGFIVEAKSKRRLSVTEAARLSLPAKGIVPRVAVTVNADDEIIAAIMREMQPDFIQFHGDETPYRIATITREYDVKTIKALPVSSATDITSAMEYAGFADYLLFDAKPPPKTKECNDVRGGHGLSFDWDILPGAALPKTWFLAGGLTPDNVREALKTGAPILDVSSGIESSPGVKDHGLVEALISITKNPNSKTRKLFYSHRVRRSIPLLSEKEYERVGIHLSNRMNDIMDYVKEHKCTMWEARSRSKGSIKALDSFEKITGVRLQHPEEIYETRISRYGRLCPDCEKPFRTPRAKFCAECGFQLPEGERAGPLTPI